MKSDYTIFIVVAYEFADEQERYHQSCEIEVIANTADEALEKAKKYITKSHYVVRHIIERIDQKCTHQA